jgi:hypothetical protein
MRTTEAKPIDSYVSRRTTILLGELRDECENVLKLLAQLELPTLQEDQAEDLLGDLSAGILHLHAHTRGLDELIDKGT